MDRLRSCEFVRCFFRPMYTPMYTLGLGWHKVLELPMEFAANVADKVGHVIELRNSLGERWPVVLASYDGTLVFGRGWEAFVKRHKLEECYVLVFRGIDSHFEVEVYNQLCKEKLTSAAHFYRPLVHSKWIHRLVLPDHISAAVADKIGQEMKLENNLGEQWTVSLSCDNGKVAFGKGWKEFVNYHNIEHRDILVFKSFDNSSLFEVDAYNGITFSEKACRRDLIRAQPEECRKGKRKIGTSSEVPDVDLGSPHMEQVSRNSRGKAVADEGSVTRKGSRSRPQETSNVYTCWAATSGRKLVLPELPPLNNKGDVVRGRMMTDFLLMDERDRCWPATYRLKTWNCSWDIFAEENGIEAGDRLSFAAYDELPATYKITVIRSA